MCCVGFQHTSHNSAFALNTSEEEPSLDVGDNFCQDCFDLASALQKCLEIASSEGVDDSIYDINRWVDDIIKYWKHQIRDYQQRQAKTFCFEQLDEDTAFWLKDFGQKVLPVRYREGQREYFGKKGMTNHIDVFFLKSGDDIIKYVYLTFISHCNQAMVDVLSKRLAERLGA